MNHERARYILDTGVASYATLLLDMSVCSSRYEWEKIRRGALEMLGPMATLSTNSPLKEKEKRVAHLLLASIASIAGSEKVEDVDVSCLISVEELNTLPITAMF